MKRGLKEVEVEEPIGGKELHIPPLTTIPQEVPATPDETFHEARSEAPVGPTVQVDVQQTQTRPDRVEGWNKRVGLLAGVVGLLLTLGGGVSAVSSHLATLDEKAETSKRRQDKQSEKYDKLQADIGDHEKTEHNHYEDLLKHATKTETNIEWIMREMKRGR